MNIIEERRIVFLVSYLSSTFMLRTGRNPLRGTNTGRWLLTTANYLLQPSHLLRLLKYGVEDCRPNERADLSCNHQSKHLN
jgi:hypothetical protein